MKLTAESVERVLLDCLFRDDEVAEPGVPPANAVLVEGVVGKFGLHRERLESHREEVEAMLAELPKEFHAETGGGWSFLNGCMRSDGEQWGEQRNVNNLFVLGQGLGLVKCPLPRTMWDILPGGMPYYIVDLPKMRKAG